MIYKKKKSHGEQLLHLISYKFRIAELSMVAVKTHEEETRAKVDGLNRSMESSMSPRVSQDALSSLPNWRERICQQKAEFEREIGQTEALSAECETELETTLRQKHAVSSYLERRKRPRS